MREIKFRAWSRGVMTILSPSTDHWVYFDEDGLTTIQHDMELMQFTGLQDCEGTDIYESDIVRVPYSDCPSKIFEKMKELGDEYIDIIFDIDSPYLATCFRTHNEDDYFTGASINGDNVMFLRYLLDKNNSKIIGNVHQDKHLLEQS